MPGAAATGLPLDIKIDLIWFRICVSKPPTSLERGVEEASDMMVGFACIISLKVSFQQLLVIREVQEHEPTSY